MHRLVLPRGQTVRSPNGMLVTYEGSMHDQYADGTTDELLQLRFQAALGPEGEPSPSALRWLPSAFAPPRLVYLSTGDCVRIVEVATDGVTLEIADATGREPTSIEPREVGRKRERVDAAAPSDPSARCPAAPSPGVACSGGPPCDYPDAGQQCVCAAPCMGAYMPDRERRWSWVCRTRPDARCPASPPSQAAVCRPNGLQCRYGTCGGATARCVQGQWQVEQHAPPP